MRNIESAATPYSKPDQIVESLAVEETYTIADIAVGCTIERIDFLELHHGCINQFPGAGYVLDTAPAKIFRQADCASHV